MVNAIATFSNWNCKQLESSLLPSKNPLILRIAIYAYQFFKFCLFLPLAIAASSFSFIVTAVFAQKAQDSKLLDFAKHPPKWSEEPTPVPTRSGQAGVSERIKIGFATADIQDSGPDKPQFEKTNWGRFYQNNKIDGQSLDMLPNTVEHPERVIDKCQELGVEEWRTAISLMPKKGEEINGVELQKYCNFFHTLKDAGISTMVTLNHFVDPEDLDWTDPESIERFVKYAVAIAPALHGAGVRQILTFNEIMVRVLQGYLFGKFPPHHTMDLVSGCKMVENMMRAHTEVYKRLKELHPDFEIGLTHDPIRFRNYHKCNPLLAPQEKLISHYFTEITHGAYMRLLLTGKFELKVPFLANESFEISEFSEKGTRPLDFIGGQYYTDPLLHIPCGSITRIDDEKLTAYGYRMYPQGIASMLEEFSKLEIPIDLTEIGIDTGVGEEARVKYFEKVFQVAQFALDQGIDLRSIYWWTRDLSWEWHEQLGKVDFSWYNEKGDARPVAEWLKERMRQPADAAVV